MDPYLSQPQLAPSSDKSSQLLIRDKPNHHRAIAIATPTHALIFRHSDAGSESAAVGPKCIVEFATVTSKLLADFRPLSPRPIFGTLGLITVHQDVFLCVVSHAQRVATLRPGETVEKIATVDFHCLNSDRFDYVVSLNTWDADPNDQAAQYAQSLAQQGEADYPYHDLQKLLNTGNFYYSTDFDLTNRLQDRPIDSDTFDIDNFDDQFLWNSFMISPLLKFRSRLPNHEREALDASRILTSAIRGFCSTVAIPQSAAPLHANSGRPSLLTVVSRLSCRRAGTRFNSRGIDDDGHVANFVETETIYWSPSGVLFSYAQVRGSVPVFWEQAAGLIPGQQKITVTRSADGTQPAFNKHFNDLEQSYGAIHNVNLLSATKPGEAELTGFYHRGVKYSPLSRADDRNAHASDHALLRHTDYDFHAETRTLGYEAARGIRRYIEHSADGFAYYLAELTEDLLETGGEKSTSRMVEVLQQEGVFRTNCLDCLDRTNLIQTLISQMAFEAFLQHRSGNAASDFWARHSTVWADNGDALSRIYAGTGALKSSFTRTGKMSLAGAFADARKSATRLYINNFTDEKTQNTIDMLLGRLVGQVPVHLYDPVSEFVSGELAKRTADFTSTENLSILVGTFNLNGRTNGIDDDLSPWLCPPEFGDTQPEIVVIGFQEIVELSAQQIMNSDPTRKQVWEKAIKRTLNSRSKQLGGEKYVHLRSGQLVGAALCIFVKASSIPKIKNVEGGVKKTGMSGIAGNKGAVAIRMDYANTQLCFVTAHLAAGFANYDERNRDYATIHHGLRFQRNRSIDDHDTVIWLGDFNYRIGLSHEETMSYVKQKNLAKLYENDQLNLQMVAGLAFPYYSEARINFMPTYKFDLGVDRYDTSEKARIPAWTDRILRKGTNIRQVAYNCAPLRFSDHRPVYAGFQCTASIVDERLREKISRQLYERRKVDIGGPAGALISEDSEDDEDLIGYDPVEPGLPAASSDQRKWWIENGKMAKSEVGPPRSTNGTSSMMLNPSRAANPFGLNDESDWVAVPRSDSRLSSFSSMSSSPYEHINHSTLLSTSASGSGPRNKMPPALDLNGLPAKVGRMNLGDEQSSARSEAAPPPPPPRRSGTIESTASLTPSATRSGPVSNIPPSSMMVPLQPTSASRTPTDSKAKPAPPIAKKPAHLAQPSPTSSSYSDSGYTPSSASGFDRQQMPTRAATTKISNLTSKLETSGGVSLTGGMQRVQSPASYTGRSIGSNDRFSGHQGSSGHSGVSLPGLGDISMLERKPVPAPRPTQQPRQQQQPQRGNPASLDLLGDDASGDMNGWETLKPS